MLVPILAIHFYANKIAFYVFISVSFKGACIDGCMVAVVVMALAAAAAKAHVPAYYSSCEARPLSLRMLAP